MKNIRHLLTAAILAGCVTGCSAQANEQPVTNSEEEYEIAQPKNATISTNPEVTDYINSIQYNEEEVLKYDLTGTITSEPGTEGTMNGNTLTVTKKTLKSVNSGTGDITVLQAADTLFPGQLLLADDKLMSGTPTTLSLARGNARFSVNLPGSTSTSFTTEVTQTDVQQNINQKCIEWGSTGYSRTANCQFSINQVFSQSQIDVKLGVGFGKKIDIDAEYETTNEKKTFIVTYTDVFFTANIIMDNDKNTIFSESVTKSQVETALTDAQGNVIPPMMINTCSFGKNIYFKVETSMTEDEVAAAFKYAGNTTVDAEETFNDMTKDSSISCLIYGGSMGTAYSSLQPLGSNYASDIATILSTDCVVNEDNILNYKLLSYTCNFIDRQQRSAGIYSTSDYIETEYYTINEQKVVVYNAGGFEIKDLWIKGRKITGYDQTTGDPIFDSNYTELYHKSHICVCQSIEYHAPANYGQITFKYDISLGQKPAYDGRISGNDFFEDAHIDTCGTTYNNYIKLTVDGVYQQL